MDRILALTRSISLAICWTDLADFLTSWGDHVKPMPVLAGAGGLDAGIERQVVQIAGGSFLIVF